MDKTNNPPGFAMRKSSSKASGPTCPWVKVPALTTAPTELLFNGIRAYARTWSFYVCPHVCSVA